MGVQTVIFGGETLMDTSGVTVTPETLGEGETALNAAGELIVGTAQFGGSGAPGGSGDLPAGYAYVNCIRFTGEQTVDTGIICNQDTKIRVVFTRENSTAQYLYGVSSTGNTASVTAYLSSGGAWRFGNKSVSMTLTGDAELVRTAIVSKNGIIRADVSNTFSGTSDFEAIGTLTIGSCRNASGTLGSAQYEGRIAAFEMWQGDEPVLKLVPVRNPDGVYGFFDTVRKAFHGSITDVPLEGGNL